jgi:protein-S-isoprenylcysteine O-methyltransferase Ste14
MREKERTQRRVLSWGAPVFTALYILPGLDRRFGWSMVPLGVVLVAEACALLGYVGVLWVFSVNRWAGRTVEVIPGQKLVTTGPYSVVRHPMYTASLLLYLATPLALGSYWGLIPALLSAVVLIARIGNEEDVLLRELPGYAEYRSKVQHRLVPGVW